MTAKRVSQKVPDRIAVAFAKRSQTCYGHFVERAKKLYVKIPFTLEEFRIWLGQQFGQNGEARCEYSGEMILVENFSVDHRTPISRSGQFDVKRLFDLDNLALCTEKHNLRKGNMTATEYKMLCSHMEMYPPEVQAAIWRKLEVGDVQRFRYFERKRKLAHQ